ncbi:MAG: manganese efflux pump MntP family protein [Oscillospiraceae bacterium]|nr:manganese efflux pump MntP family protein [Oscillospiraceae bacterium]
MRFWELVIIALALSMDAFAVAVCKGCAAKIPKARHAVIIGLYFGIFQSLMPFLGYMLGDRFIVLIESIDHWIAFALMVLIGGKMVYDTRDENDAKVDDSLDMRAMLPLAVATSIDAFAVGITFSALGVSPLMPPLLVIGATTFVLSALGVIIGQRFGARFHRKAAFAGGLALMFLGMKIFAEHMGWIA